MQSLAQPLLIDYYCLLFRCKAAFTVIKSKPFWYLEILCFFSVIWKRIHFKHHADRMVFVASKRTPDSEWLQLTVYCILFLSLPLMFFIPVCSAQQQNLWPLTLILSRTSPLISPDGLKQATLDKCSSSCHWCPGSVPGLIFFVCHNSYMDTFRSFPLSSLAYRLNYYCICPSFCSRHTHELLSDKNLHKQVSLQATIVLNLISRHADYSDNVNKHWLLFWVIALKFIALDILITMCNIMDWPITNCCHNSPIIRTRSK